MNNDLAQYCRAIRRTPHATPAIRRRVATLLAMHQVSPAAGFAAHSAALAGLPYDRRAARAWRRAVIQATMRF